MANNYFRYASDSCPVKLAGGYEDKFPQAKSDPIGLACPLMSHIRKVNTRDSANDAGGTLASFNQRLLRRGLSYGPPLAGSAEPACAGSCAWQPGPVVPQLPDVNRRPVLVLFSRQFIKRL